jgi:hypothetical protein
MKRRFEEVFKILDRQGFRHKKFTLLRDEKVPEPPAEGSLAWRRLQVARPVPDILSDTNLQMHLRGLDEETRRGKPDPPPVVSLEVTLLERVCKDLHNPLESMNLLELLRLQQELHASLPPEILHQYRHTTPATRTVSDHRDASPTIEHYDKAYDPKMFTIPLQRLLNPEFQADGTRRKGRRPGPESEKLNAALRELVTRPSDLRKPDFFAWVCKQLDGRGHKWPPDAPKAKQVKFSTILRKDKEERDKVADALRNRARNTNPQKR